MKGKETVLEKRILKELENCSKEFYTINPLKWKGGIIKSYEITCKTHVAEYTINRTVSKYVMSIFIYNLKKSDVYKEFKTLDSAKLYAEKHFQKTIKKHLKKVIKDVLIRKIKGQL